LAASLEIVDVVVFIEEVLRTALVVQRQGSTVIGIVTDGVVEVFRQVATILYILEMLDAGEEGE